MRRRFLLREKVSADQYLVPEIVTGLDENGIVDIIYGEYALREENGQAIPAEEYCRRFPQYEPMLRRQFEIHDALTVHCSAPDPYDLPTVDRTSPPPETAPDLVQIGRYIIVSRLGSGGQANVYRALHPDLECEVAIKISNRSLELDRLDGERLANEAKLLAGLSHPNLVRVFDIGIHESRPYIVMEFVRGRSLSQVARSEKRSLAYWVEILSQVSSALAAVHAKGILHLDIKPQNILINEQGAPVVIDFGLSQVDDAWTHINLADDALCGTLQYMPPEQARGESDQFSPRTDIFMLGGVLYFLLTGVPPYQSQDFVELLSDCQRGDWNQALLVERQTPKRIQQVCQTAMAADPADRYSNMAEFASQMTAAVCPKQPTRFTSAPVFGIAAALLLVLGYVFWKPTPAPAPYTSSLQVQVWDSKGSSHLTDVVPLRNGDNVKIEAKTPSGHYGSLFLVSSDGEVQLLSQVSPSKQEVRVSYPTEDSQVAPIVGSPGTELVLFCARRTSPIELAEIQSLWSSDAKWPALPNFTVLRVDSQGVQAEQRDKGLGNPVDRQDPEALVEKRLVELQKKLGVHIDVVEGIAFAHSK